jgi:Cdc6-like AAA superfamily ATPase
LLHDPRPLRHRQTPLPRRVHCQQGGLCLVVGEPGTGKTVIKQAPCKHDPKRLIAPVVNRTLHTYHSTLRILCEAFQLDTDGRDFLCERRNDDIKSRVTYSVLMQRLAPDDLLAFIHEQLDRVALAHSTFTPDALQLIVRASEGLLRRARNLCVATMLEAVRDRVRSVDLKQVNRVLMQPHWRREQDIL